MDPALDFAARVARQAGLLLLEHFDPAGSRSRRKKDASVVTEADMAADHLISRAITDRFPEDAILSEELHPAYSDRGAATWVIDPLDGTTNFSLGLPFWGVSIARLDQAGPAVAALYFPILDELYCAQKGHGAARNDVPIQVKPFNPKQPAAFFSCCTRTHRRYQVQVPFKTRILGSAAYSFCTIAKGSAVLAFEATPKVWDLAGGWLLVKEAGGVIAPLKGESPFPLQPGVDYSQRNYPTIAAGTESMLARGRQQIRPRS